MSIHKWLVGLAGVVLVFGGAPVAVASLIANGGFETPPVTNGWYLDFGYGQNLGGWTVVGSHVALVPSNYAETSNGVSQFNAAEGFNSLDLTGTGNIELGSGVQQTIPTVEGTAYSISFDVGRVTGAPGVYPTPAIVDLSINGGPRVSFTNNISTPGMINWQEFSTSFIATGSSTTITFYNGTLYTNYAGLDDVRVTPASEGAVPEPSTLVLWSGLGALGLVMAWRRRKSA